MWITHIFFIHRFEHYINNVSMIASNNFDITIAKFRWEVAFVSKQVKSLMTISLCSLKGLYKLYECMLMLFSPKNVIIWVEIIIQTLNIWMRKCLDSIILKKLAVSVSMSQTFSFCSINIDYIGKYKYQERWLNHMLYQQKWSSQWVSNLQQRPNL